MFADGLCCARCLFPTTRHRQPPTCAVLMGNARTVLFSGIGMLRRLSNSMIFPHVRPAACWLHGGHCAYGRSFWSTIGISVSLTGNSTCSSTVSTFLLINLLSTGIY